MKKLILFLLIICLTAGVASATLLKGPYLIYPGVNTTMDVLWQLDTTASCTIEWGTSTSYGNSSGTTEYGSDHQHKHTIANLTPGTKYFYRVDDGLAYYTGTFYAAPSTSATSVSILGFGDCRTNTATFDSVAAQIISAYQADSSYQTITMLSGDWVNNGRDEDEWTAQFFDRSYTNITAMQANLPINGVTGNHETLSATGNDGDIFAKYYPYPYVDAAYWSFDYGPIHIACLDQYDGGYGSISTAQLAWLEADLAATDKSWKIIQLHQPGYSADGQGAHTDTQQVRDSIQPLCEQYGVDIVFAGHNHYYARCEKAGIVHLTSGGAGPTLDTPDLEYTGYVVAVSKKYHFCKIDVDGVAEEMTVTVVDSTGSIIESFVIDGTFNPDLPWADDFESGDFAGGRWTQSNDRYCEVDGTDSYTGTYSGMAERSGNYLAKEISTVGFTDIHVEYARKVDSGSMVVEWTTDESSWNTLETASGASWSYQDKLCASGADGSTTFQVRFRVSGGNKDSFHIDDVSITGTASIDDEAPTPDPMTWATTPYSTGESSIAMVADTASDASGVEYFFDCITVGGHDSGWQSGASYEDTGLVASTQYTYQVKARDKSPNLNETALSGTSSATTDSSDTTAPTPDPMTWSTAPYSTGDSSIAMVASTASDGSGVEYFFDCITVGGHDSIWQDSTIYEDSGLNPNTQYTYQVKARDKSAAQNETALSTTGSATTDTSDTTAPTPDPMTWSTVPYSTGSSSIAMVADTASDVSGVEYLFDCTAGGGNDSGWQDSPSYEDTGLSSNAEYTYQVQARDKSSNNNATAFSTTESATTDTAGLLPFSDTFLVYGDFGTGGWTTGGDSTNVLNQCACEGELGAQMKKASWMEKAISTEGFTSITVSYSRKTSGMDAGEFLYAEWYDGTDWNQFEATQITGCGYVNQSCGSGADNNPNFKVRFSTTGNKNNEYGCVDYVTIDGTPQ